MSIYKIVFRAIRNFSKKLIDCFNLNSLIVDDFGILAIIGLVISIIGIFLIDDIDYFFVGIVSGILLVLLFLIVSGGLGWLISRFFDSEERIFKPLMRFLLAFHCCGAIIMSCIRYSGYSTSSLGMLFVLSCSMLALSRFSPPKSDR